MCDFTAIAKNIPFQVECFMKTTTGQAQKRENSHLKIGWYWHEKEGVEFSFEDKKYKTLPALLESNPLLADEALHEYGMRDNAS